MAKLFDKITGTGTNYDSNGISDSSASWEIDQFKDWFVVIGAIEYKIIANTATTLLFTNSISSNQTYIIQFIGRTYLTELESDLSNTTRVPDDLISKKYNQANLDIHNKVFSYLRGLYKSDFDPLTYIFNIEVLQQAFAYYMLAKIYQDLMLDQDSFEGFKGYNMYEKSYIDGIKDGLALLQIDYNKDGEVDVDEKTNSASTFSFLAR
jgi:hypothetical protein